MALDNTLKKRQHLGLLGMLSGDPALGGVGQALLGDVDTQSQLNFRRTQAEAQRKLQEQGLNLRRQGLAETSRHNKMMELLSGYKADLAAQTAMGARIDKGVETLSSRLEKGDYIGFGQAIENVEKMIQSYGDKGIPGVGFLQNKLQLSEEGRQNHATVMQMVNMLLKSQAGTAVSGPEEARQLRALMIGPNASEEGFKKAFEMIKDRYTQVVNNVVSPVNPRVQDAYFGRGGRVPYYTWESDSPVELDDEMNEIDSKLNILLEMFPDELKNL